MLHERPGDAPYSRVASLTGGLTSRAPFFATLAARPCNGVYVLKRFAHRVHLVRGCSHKRLLEGPKDQGARRPGARDAKEGGRGHLRGLARHPQALAQAPPRGGGCSAEAFAGTDPAHPRHRRAATRPLGATRRERRRPALWPPRALGAKNGRGGLGFDDEPGRAQAGLDLQKKSLAATERDEEARSAFRQRLRGVDPKRLLFASAPLKPKFREPRFQAKFAEWIFQATRWIESKYLTLT